MQYLAVLLTDHRYLQWAHWQTESVRIYCRYFFTGRLFDNNSDESLVHDDDRNNDNIFEYQIHLVSG